MVSGSHPCHKMYPLSKYQNSPTQGCCCPVPMSWKSFQRLSTCPHTETQLSKNGPKQIRISYPCGLYLRSLWLGLRPGSVGPRSFWVLRSRLLLGIIRVLLWTRLMLLLLIFAVAVRVKVIRLGRTAAKKVRIKIRIIPEASRPLPSVGVRGRRRSGELPLASVLPLPPWRWMSPLLLVIIRKLARLSLPPPHPLRIPAEAKLSDVRETDLVEEAKILLRQAVVHGIVWTLFNMFIILSRPRLLTLWSHSLRLSLKWCRYII